MILTLFLSAILAHASPGWQKTDDGDGVTIFEQEDPSGFLAFRAEGVVDSDLHAVASAILDPDHTPDWVEHLEEDRVLRRGKDGHFLEYTHVGTPFVLKDRDFLCDVHVHAVSGSLVIESHSVEDPAQPPTKYVRGAVVHNEFRLTPMKGGHTMLKGEFHIDPKGSVAKWIVNLFQHAWPKKAFKAIQKRAAERKSQLPAALEPILEAFRNS